MNTKKTADVLAVLSVLSVLIAGYVNLSKADVFNLAGTQWILIGIVLGIYAMYLRMRD
jgi:hypothetical protein